MITAPTHMQKSASRDDGGVQVAHEHRPEPHQHRAKHRPAHLALALEALELQLTRHGRREESPDEDAGHQTDVEPERRVGN